MKNLDRSRNAWFQMTSLPTKESLAQETLHDNSAKKRFITDDGAAWSER